MICVPKELKIHKVPFLGLVIPVALVLCLNSNHVVTAQRSGPSTEPQLGVTIDDKFAAIARAVPSFGGLFIRDDHLNVYLTSRADLQAAMVAIVGVFGRTRLPLENPVALQGRFNFTQLKAWHDLHRLKTLASPGVQSVDIDERNNRLQVDVLSYQAQSDIKEQLENLRIPGAAFNISLVEPASITNEHASYTAKAGRMAMPVVDPPTVQDKWRPVAGGIQISAKGDGNCTLSFLAVRQHEAGFVTCSHCTTMEGSYDGQVVSQPKPDPDGINLNLIGSEKFDPSLFSGGACPSGRKCRYSDSVFIKRDSTISQLYPLTQGDFGALLIPLVFTMDPNEVYLSPVIKHEIVALAGESISGEVLQKSGRTTGRTAGEVTGTCVDQNQNKKVDGKSVDINITMLCQDKMAAIDDGGDSGAPVFKLEDSADAVPKVKLYGIEWGGNGQELWFSPINQVTWGAELGDLKIHKGQNPDSKPEVKIFKPVDNGAIFLPLGQPVTFEAAAVDFEDATLKFDWTSVDDNTYMGSGASLPPYTFSTPGPRKIKVTVTDSDNNTASHQITVTVAQNTPPIVTIDVPTANYLYHADNPVALSGTGVDPNEQNGTLPCSNLYWEISQPPVKLFPSPVGTGCSVQSFKFPNAGNYIIWLTGTDSMGASDTATVKVTVIDADAPWAQITGPLGTELKAYQKTSLEGKGWNIPDVGPITYDWAISIAGVRKGITGGTAPNNIAFTNPFTPADYFPLLCGTKQATVFLTVKNANGKTIEVSSDYLITFGQCPMP